MKTSTKLLLGFAIVSFLTIALLMILAKSNLISRTEYKKEMKLSGVSIDRILVENLTTDHIEMGDNFEWIIDPSSTQVMVTGDKAVVSKLEISDSGQFRIKTGPVGNRDYGLVTVNVGTKNLKKLKLSGNGNARISATSAFALDDLNVIVNGNARCELNVDSPRMKISCNGNGKLTLLGAAESINADVNGNGKLYLEDLSVKAVTVYVSGNGRYYGGAVETISGTASGNGKIEIKDASERNNVSTSGNGRFTINR